jgi:hypothetical protein
MAAVLTRRATARRAVDTGRAARVTRAESAAACINRDDTRQRVCARRRVLSPPPSFTRFVIVISTDKLF